MLTIPLALLMSCTRDVSPNPDDTSDSTPTDTSDSGVPDGPEALCQIEVTCPGHILNDPKAPCDAVVQEGDGTVVYEGDAGFELRGRSSLDFPKHSYGVELRDYHELATWPGSAWSYLDDGADPGPGWQHPDFDDSRWPRGPAPLGFNAPDLVTTTTADPNVVTTWFRRTFSVYHADSVTRARVGVQREDGVVIYVNGTEVLRDNLPQHATADTWATEAVTPQDAVTWLMGDFPPNLLRDGDNTLAVELHQAEDSVDDQRFDLYLEALGDEAAVNFGGMGAEADWVLNGLYADRVLFRNRLASDLFQSFGGKERYAPESRFCELQIDGEYVGLYSLGERIERDDDRVDLPKSETPGDTFIVKLDDEKGFHANAIGVGTWQLVYPDANDENEEAVADYLVRWERAVQGADPANPQTGIFAYVDLESAVDFVLLQEFMRNNDAYFLSVHLWRAPDGKLHFTPWDLDLSMGYPVDHCGGDGWLYRVEFVDAMARVPAFHDRLVQRWAELRAGPLAEDAILARIDGYDETLAPGLDRNVELWPVDEIAFSTDELDQWLCPADTYAEEHERVLTYIHDRLAWMDANIDTY